MKKLMLAVVAVMFSLSSLSLYAADNSSGEKETYIPWTWDDITD